VIDLEAKPDWMIADLPIDRFLVGDCRQAQLLEKAQIRQCQAILLVTSYENVNVETAFAARSLNPQVRLIVRSSQDTLNELLTEHLGNFIALEPIQLPASSFALAALGGQTRGFFSLDHQLLKVVRVQVDPHHKWCNCRQLSELNTSTRRILSHHRGDMTPAKQPFQWEPSDTVQAGDTISYIEVSDRRMELPAQKRSSWFQQIQIALPAIGRNLQWQTLRQRLLKFWQESNQTQRVGSVSALIILSLYSCGVISYKFYYGEQITWQNAFNIALVLILGGYDNLFGGSLKLDFLIAWQLQLFSIVMTIAGTIFIGIFYAMLTERLLAARFQFSKRRPPMPKAHHVVLIGLGRVGQRVATLLQDLKQPLVGVHASALDASILPQIPLVTGSLKTVLTRVNLATAKSVIAVTDDEIVNLEIALRAYAANPRANLVIRTFEQGFSDHVARLLPTARVLSAYALSAEAFAAAAFGENVLTLFRLNQQTLLVTEYHISETDTLQGKLLGEVAYGYGVVPILHQRTIHEPPKFMPTDDIRFSPGDRLVVLASIEALQRVERGLMAPRRWQVSIAQAKTPEAVLEGAMTISRVSGCEIGLARQVMNQLPATLNCPLYRHQAQRLVRELSKVQVRAQSNQRPL
jgi:Trk K+ transport system NAD-binding subunit